MAHLPPLAQPGRPAPGGPPVGVAQIDPIERQEQPKVHPKERGEITEAAVIATLIEYRYSVSVPFGDNQRYDLIVDDGTALHRVQVKTARDEALGESIAFRTSSQHCITAKRTTYEGQIEAFIAYLPRTRTCYWIPIDECLGRDKMLRLVPARNNQRHGVRMAADYELRPNLRT
jgi:hypothetical protein